MSEKFASWFMGIIMVISSISINAGTALEGRWTATVDCASAVNTALVSSMDDTMASYFDIPEFEITASVEFREDGTYSLSVDREALQGTIEIFKQTCKDGMRAYMEFLLEEEGFGMSVDDFLALSGTTMDELFDEVITDDMVDGLVDEIAETIGGSYAAEDGKLFITLSSSEAIDENQYFTYELEGDTMRLLSCSYEDLDLIASVFPITLERAD